MSSSKATPESKPLLDMIEKRWSPRAYTERPIDKQTLSTIFEAARWSASAFNEQPWRFIVATQDKPVAYERLLSCLVEANQQWAKTAPVLALCIARKKYTSKDTKNRHAWHDLGLASSQLIMQASSMDIYCHLMAGINAERAIEIFNIPAQFIPVTGMTLGYVDLPQPTDRQRKPLAEFVYANQWETSFF
jgi:nitroreductase